MFDRLNSDKGEKMKRTFSKMMFGILLLTIGLSGISCSKEKSAGKAAQTPEQAKMVEEYQKGIEESKKTIIAKVNGVDISMSELITEMNTVAPLYIKPGQKKTPEIDAQVQKEALDRLIYRELALQAAVKQGLSVPPEKIDQEIKKTKADLKSEEVYKQNLAARGMTEAELRKRFERAFLVEMITEKEVFDKVNIDPGLIRKTYEREKASYRGPSGQMSYEEAKPAIEEKLMTPLVQKREDEWVNEMKKNAKIEITLDKAAKAIQSVQ